MQKGATENRPYSLGSVMTPLLAVVFWAVVSMVSCSSPTNPNNPYSGLSRPSGGNVTGLAQQQPGSWLNLDGAVSRIRLSGMLTNGAQVFVGSLTDAKLVIVGQNPVTQIYIVDIYLDGATQIYYAIVPTPILAQAASYSIRIDRGTGLELTNISGITSGGVVVLPAGWKWIIDTTGAQVVVLDNFYFGGANGNGGGGNGTNGALSDQPAGSWWNISGGVSRLRLSGLLTTGMPVYGNSLSGAKLIVVAQDPSTRLYTQNVVQDSTTGIWYAIVPRGTLSNISAYSVRIDKGAALEEIAIAGNGPAGSSTLPAGWKWRVDERNIQVVVLLNAYFQ